MRRLYFKLSLLMADSSTVESFYKSLCFTECILVFSVQYMCAVSMLQFVILLHFVESTEDATFSSVGTFGLR